MPLHFRTALSVLSQHTEPLLPYGITRACSNSHPLEHLLFLCFPYAVDSLSPYPYPPTPLQLLTKERSHTLSASKGALCLFGSTDFATQFQAHWAREGYCDYTQPPQAATLSGTHVSRWLFHLC